VIFKFRKEENNNENKSINSETQERKPIELNDALRDKTSSSREKEENKEGEKKEVVNKFKQRHEVHISGDTLYEIGFSLATTFTFSFVIASTIAYVLRDPSLAKSLLETGLGTWWVGFTMIIAGKIKKENEDWPWP